MPPITRYSTCPLRLAFRIFSTVLLGFTPCSADSVMVRVTPIVSGPLKFPARHVLKDVVLRPSGVLRYLDIFSCQDLLAIDLEYQICAPAAVVFLSLLHGSLIHRSSSWCLFLFAVSSFRLGLLPVSSWLRCWPRSLFLCDRFQVLAIRPAPSSFDFTWYHPPCFFPSPDTVVPYGIAVKMVPFGLLLTRSPDLAVTLYVAI